MRSILSALLVLVSFVAEAKIAIPPSEPVLIPVAGVYAPENGYDDNDSIQVVVDGVLPNACWVVDHTEAKVLSPSNDIIVQQYARKQDSEACRNPEKLPPELKLPVSFMSEVSLGVLPHGQYQMVFSATPGGAITVKPLNISRAPTTEIDSLYYAITTELYVPKAVSADRETTDIRFSGYLSNPCSEMEADVMAVIQKDVIVLLPSVHRYDGTCLPIAQEFTRVVTIKTPVAGRYLVQVRSANGNSVNRFMTIR